MVELSDQATIPAPPPQPFLTPLPLPLLHPHRLDICKLPDPQGSQLPPVARPLDPSERDSGIRSHHPVDEHHPGVQFIDELPLLGGIVGPGTGTQPKPTVVCDSNRIANV